VYQQLKSAVVGKVLTFLSGSTMGKVRKERMSLSYWS